MKAMQMTVPRWYLRAALACGLAAACVVPAHAQSYDYVYTRPGASQWQGHVMGGYAPTSGVIANYLQGGWMIDGGFTFWPRNGGLGIRADLGYSAHNVTNQFIAFGEQATGEQVDDGRGSFLSIAAGPVFRVPAGRGRFYGYGQAGLTHVRMELNQTFFVPGYYCDPFFGYCDYNYGIGAVSVYDYSVNKLGWNVGFGLEFPARWGQSWFVEAQYHRVETPQPLEYWPITVGLRF